MLPPTLVRRLVLAPMVIVLALGLIVLSPLLLVLALLFGLAGLLRAGRMRNLRLVSFLMVGLTTEIVTLVLLFGLWIVSGFGGRLHTEPYQSRHYRVVRWFLDALYRGAERTYGLRVEIDEPSLTGDELAARLTRPVIVLSRHAGPGDSFLLIHQLLSVYGRRPRVVMKAALQFDPSLDVLGNRLPNVFVKHRQTGESIFTEQIERLARGLGPDGALVIFPEGANWTPSRWRRGIRRLEHAGRRDLALTGPSDAEPAATAAGRDAGRHPRLPGRGCDLRGARRAGHDHLHRRCVAAVPGRPANPGPVVAGAVRPGAAGGRSRGAGAVAVRVVGAGRRVDHREPPRRFAGPGPGGGAAVAVAVA